MYMKEEKIILSRAEIPNDARDLRIATEIAQNFAKYIWEKLDAKAIKPDRNGTTQFEPFLFLKDVKQILQIEGLLKEDKDNDKQKRGRNSKRVCR